MRLDLVLEPDTPKRFHELGLQAEALGFGAVWTANHVNAPDPFVAFASLASASEKLILGPVAVSPYELHPIKIANQLLTLNLLAPGRARVVIGGGGGAVIAMGLKPGRRAMMPRMVRAVTEAIEIVKQAATGAMLNYQGELFNIAGYQAGWADDQRPLVYAAATKPQMLAMAAKTADGVMLSDVTLPRIDETVGKLRASLEQVGRNVAQFPISNLYAWHVKPRRSDALREARAKLFVRGMLESWYISPFLTKTECELVEQQLGEFAQAYINNSPEVANVPTSLVDELAENLTFVGDYSDIDKFIDQLRAFKAAGVTEFALRLYYQPEESMQLIADQVMPALA